MSPNMPDDAVVRALHDRADRAVPPMALDPDTVLAKGRRYRRRRTTMLSTAGALGVAAIALGAVQLIGWGDDPGPAPAAQLVSVGDFTVVAATEVVPVEPDGEARPGTLHTPGTLYDTGIPVDPADPDGARWALEHVMIDPAELLPDMDPEDMPLDLLVARSYDPASGESSEWLASASNERGDGVSEPEVDPYGIAHADTFIAYGLMGRGYASQAYLTGAAVPDASAEESRVLLPSFTIPGIDGDLYFLRVAGERPWPHITVYPSVNTGLTLNANPDDDPWGR